MDNKKNDIQGRVVFSQEGTVAQKISEEGKDLEIHGMTDNNSMEIDIGANDNMHALVSQLPIPIDVEDKQDGI